ncbi:MAG: WD40 repeat domain-containing protein [Candidatus Babeliaceae bacterium]|nr:WD40 repeat domain-containing protein [Candidatus Babeliaceae bacterium]
MKFKNYISLLFFAGTIYATHATAMDPINTFKTAKDYHIECYCINDDKIISADCCYLRTFNLSDGKLLVEALYLQRRDCATSIDAYKDTIVLGDTEGNIKVFDSRKEKFLKIPEAHTQEVTSIKMIDEVTIVSGSADGNLKIWKKKTGNWEMFKELEAHTAKIIAIIYEDNKIMTASNEQITKIWDLDGNLKETRTDFNWGIHCKVDKTIIYPTCCNTFAILDVSGSQHKPVYKLVNELKDKDSNLKILVATKNKIVAGYEDGTVKIWNDAAFISQKCIGKMRLNLKKQHEAKDEKFRHDTLFFHEQQ